MKSKDETIRKILILTILAFSLIAYIPLVNASTVTTLFSNGFEGTVNQVVSAWTSNDTNIERSQAIKHSGNYSLTTTTGQEITKDLVASMDNYTLSLWVYLHLNSPIGNTFIKAILSGALSACQITSVRSVERIDINHWFYQVADSSWIDSGISVKNNTWIHLILKADQSLQQVKLSIDGHSYTFTNTTDIQNQPIDFSSATITIGIYTTGDTPYLDDVLVTNTELANSGSAWTLMATLFPLAVSIAGLGIVFVTVFSDEEPFRKAIVVLITLSFVAYTLPQAIDYLYSVL
jgi:hypothetical protein